MSESAVMRLKPRGRWYLPLLVVLVVSVTCSDGPTGPEPPDRTPVQLIASHDSVTIAVSDSAVVWVETRNAQSALVIPPNLLWRSLDAAVAAVDAGKIRGASVGVTRVIASYAVLADTIAIRIVPAITRTSLTVLGDTIRSLGGRAELLARAFADAEPREGSYTYTVHDASVLSLEDARPWGTVFARGLKEGSTHVVAAERGGTRDSVIVTVAPSFASMEFLTAPMGHVGHTIVPVLGGRDSSGRSLTASNVSFRTLDTSIARPVENGIYLAKVGFTRVEAISQLGARALGEIRVRPFPRLQAHIMTNGFNLRPIRLGVGHVAVGGFVMDGPMRENVIETRILGESIVAAEVTPDMQLRLTGLGEGAARVVVSSPFMQGDTIPVIVTSSRIHLTNSYVSGMRVGQSVTPTVFVGDSDGLRREYASDIPATVTSSDTTVVRVEPASRHVVLPRRAEYDLGIQLTGVAPGTARVTVSAPGFVSAEQDFSVATLPQLELTGATLMGAGQTLAPESKTPWRVAASDRSSDVTVTLSHSDPTVATSPAQVVLTPLHLYMELLVRALKPGIDTIVASAPGFVPDTVVLRVSSPRFAPAGQFPIVYLDGAGRVLVGVGDSTGVQHVPINDVSVVSSSSDSSIIVPGSTTLPAGWRGPWPLPRTILDTGTADVTVHDAAGLIPSMVVPVRAALSPTLVQFASDPDDLRMIGVAQRFGGPVSATLDFFFAEAPIEVSYWSTDPGVLPASGAVTIPTGGRTATIQLPVPTAMGTARLVISAKGFRPDTSPLIEVGQPRLAIAEFPRSVSAETWDSVRVRLTDQRGRHRVTDSPVTFRMSVVGGGLAETETTIPAGASESSAVPVKFTRSGRLQLVAYVPSGSSPAYAPDTAVVMVQTNKTLAFEPTAVTVGIGQRVEVTVNRNRFDLASPLTASIASRAARVTAPTNVTFPAQSTTQPVALIGKQAGVDTITAVAADYTVDSVRVVVTQGRMRLTGVTGAMKRGASSTVSLVATDSAGVDRQVSVNMVFSVATSEGLSVTTTEGVPLTTVTIPSDGSASSAFIVKATATGEQSLLISRLDYLPLRVNVNVVP